MTVASLCNKTAAVTYNAYTSDAFGTATATSTSRYTALPCRLQPMSGNMRMMYARERVEVSHRLYWPADYTAVAEQDIVTVDSVAYEVRFVRNPDLADSHYEADLRRLKGAV